MQLSKDEAKRIFAPLPEALKRIDKISGDIVYFDLLSAQSTKPKQNNLVRFWLSGCSSFGDYDALRNFIINALAGTWLKRKDSVILVFPRCKEQAKTAIDMCLRDMDASGVIGRTKRKNN